MSRALTALGVALLAASTPSLAQGSKIFSLKFEAERPFRIVVGQGTEPRDTFWVIPYWLENNTGQDRKFWLEITAVSDKNRTYRDNSYGWAYDRIRKHLNLQEDEVLWWHEHVTFAHSEDGERQFSEAPKLDKREGADSEPKDDFPIELTLPVIRDGQRVRCVAVFRNLDPEMDRCVVTIRGLNNIRKIEKIEDHVTRVTERVLKLTYSRPGDEFYTPSDIVRFVDKEWADEVYEFRTDLR